MQCWRGVVLMPDFDAQFLTEAELAKLLRVDRSTISRLVSSGKLPFEPLILGERTRRYPVAQVHEVIESLSK